MNSEKLDNLVASYIHYVNNHFDFHKNEEEYKFINVKIFQENFDISSINSFKKKIDEALQISNLIQSGNYYPRKVILDFLKYDEVFVFNEINKLFDERIDLISRIDNFKNSFEEKRKELLNNKIIDKLYKQTYIDYRFVSYLLSCYKPENYIFVKNNEYQFFLKQIDAEKNSGKTAGQKYQLFLKYANFARNKLKNNKKYQEFHKKLVEGTGYTDESLSWGTQDFIFSIKRYSLSPSSNMNGILDLQQKKSQIILFGPPGTGKTYHARKFAVNFINEYLEES